MAKQGSTTGKKGFGMAPVFFTSISSILGAILFLRLGWATGMLGFYGVIAIIILGHLITIPTALAISELATNTRVEGGGEYFIISRSFGLKIGSTIGLTLFLSQAISIAFYTIAFAESFYPFFDWWHETTGFILPRQIVSVPALLMMAYVILKKGAGSGVKLLYVVNIILAISFVMFFLGKPVELIEMAEDGTEIILGSPKGNFGFFNPDSFFVIFAICFPAFTGMTAGVGLSGDLRDPGRSIPIGTMLGTITGLIVYVFVVWKLAVSASPEALVSDQMIMSKIAVFGAFVIPIGLAACTSSSALGAMMVAPRTLQAIAFDRTFPFRKLNLFLARGRGKNKEPRNASLISFMIALVFVLLGDVNSVAEIISMFFLITYGTLCLNSFLNHFGSPPSYRPKFRSKWFISLAGFLLSVWVMFMINPLYTIIAYIVIVIIYLFLEHTNKDEKGLVNIFRGAIFQLNRKLQVFMQKNQASMDSEEWRPAVVCISQNTFERERVLKLMKWISYKHGFGTYFHYIHGYFGEDTHKQSLTVLSELLHQQKGQGSSLYLDTMISPSYTSALAQVIQAPSISGMENNMVLFEYIQSQRPELERIMSETVLVKAGGFDVAIFSQAEQPNPAGNDIHLWIRESDSVNTNFMILLGYIMLSHPSWKKKNVKLFQAITPGSSAEATKELQQRIEAGRLPITMQNIEIVEVEHDEDLAGAMASHSDGAALSIIGFGMDEITNGRIGFFTNFHGLGDILFVNTSCPKEIG